MFSIETDQTVTLRRPDPESGELVIVDVHVPAGEYGDAPEGVDPGDFAAALEALWSAGLADDEARPHVVGVTDISALAAATVAEESGQPVPEVPLVDIAEPKSKRTKSPEPTKAEPVTAAASTEA